MMSEIKDSLDQLLHVMKNGENDKSVEVYYVIKPKNFGRLTNIGDEEIILHITARRASVDILLKDGSDITIQKNSGQASFILDNKPFEFLEAIAGLLEAASYSSSLGMSKRMSAFIGQSDNVVGFYECVLILFLKMIHQECQNKPKITAEELIGLRYPLFHVVSLRNAEVIEEMLIRGCPVNDRHPTDNSTALSKAVDYMNLDIVNVLIKYGADVDLADSRGRLPIARYNTWHANGGHQQPEIIKIFLEKSTLLRDLPREDVARQFREAFRCGNQEVIQMLLQHRDGILKVRDSNNRTLLHYLSENPHPDITELLKNHEIDVNARDESGCTPLYWAAGIRDSHINTFKFLLENGADVNARNNFGDVPIFRLCRETEKKYAVEILGLFWQYGLDVEYVRCWDQTTIFDVIKGNFFCPIAILLLQYYANLDVRAKPITELIRKKISSYKSCTFIFNKFKAELVKMKSINISGNLTLFMIFINEVSEKQILKTCQFSSEALKNLEKVTQEFCHDDCCYSGLLQKRISSIVKRLKLMQKAAPFISQLLQLGNNPYHIIVTEIMYYLDTQDLQALIEVEI